jgi:hypothetical protein
MAAPKASTGGVTLTLTSYELYLALLVLGIATAVLGFVTHTIPSWAGYAGTAAALVLFFGYLADQFLAASAWEYLTVTVVAAIVGLVGTFSGIQNVTLATFLVWMVAILAAIYNSVTENGADFLDTQQATWAIGLTGAALSFFTWWSNNPTATEAAIVTTLVVTVGQFVRVTVNTTPTPAPAPTTAKSG